jgi:probable F420-dependent oxidoreductase
MKLDTMLATGSLQEVAAHASRFEAMGFDGMWSIEAQHDPFLPLAVAATATTRLGLGTAIAVAFPRSPMTLAYTAWDLAAASKGRFILGLGTQVKGHNERRFSVKWEQPVKKLREVILSLRAIWDSWQNGTKLDFRGEFYSFTLMTPFFSPPKLDQLKIPIFIAGVNPLICRLAGEVADGFHVHPFHSVKFLKESVIPDIEAGGQKAGRSRKDVQLSTQAFLILGDTAEERAKAREDVRSQISFYASTRTYQPVLDAHGWGEVAQRLSYKAAKGDWASMSKEITDEMIDVYALEGTPDDIAGKLHTRYDGLLDRVSSYTPYRPGKDDERWQRIVSAFQK